MITNANVVACLGAVQTVLGNVVKHGETYIAFLVSFASSIYPSSSPRC